MGLASGAEQAYPAGHDEHVEDQVDVKMFVETLHCFDPGELNIDEIAAFSLSLRPRSQETTPVGLTW